MRRPGYLGEMDYWFGGIIKPMRSKSSNAAVAAAQANAASAGREAAKQRAYLKGAPQAVIVAHAEQLAGVYGANANVFIKAFTDEFSKISVSTPSKIMVAAPKPEPIGECGPQPDHKCPNQQLHVCDYPMTKDYTGRYRRGATKQWICPGMTCYMCMKKASVQETASKAPVQQVVKVPAAPAVISTPKVTSVTESSKISAADEEKIRACVTRIDALVRFGKIRLDAEGKIPGKGLTVRQNCEQNVIGKGVTKASYGQPLKSYKAF